MLSFTLGKVDIHLYRTVIYFKTQYEISTMRKLSSKVSCVVISCKTELGMSQDQRVATMSNKTTIYSTNGENFITSRD